MDVPSDGSCGAGETLDDGEQVIVLIEADEGGHASFEDEPAFEHLPHPLSVTPLTSKARAALAPLDVKPNATTHDVMERVGNLHPLLRYHVF